MGTVFDDVNGFCLAAADSGQTLSIIGAVLWISV
jgi:hypothetical protein